MEYIPFEFSGTFSLDRTKNLSFITDGNVGAVVIIVTIATCMSNWSWRNLDAVW